MNIINGILAFLGFVFVGVICLFLICAMIISGRYDKDDE